MTVTYQHLSGAYENTDKTIAYHLENDWTETVYPTFQNGTDEPDYNAQFDNSDPNTILVNTIESDSSRNDDEVNSDTIHSTVEKVIITIIAESREQRILFENEVNRIIWEMSPNTGTRVTKSDGTNSHIDHFERSQVDFKRVDIADDDTRYLENSEGELLLVYYKFKT